MQAITILIADSIDFCRDSLQGFITAQSHTPYQLLDTACSAQEVLEKTKEQQPKILVIDVNLPGMCSVELCRQVLQLCSATRIIGRTTEDMAYHARRMMKAGGHGMLRKDASKAEIGHCLNWVHQGNFHFGEECSHLLSRRYKEEKELSELEQRVLLNVCRWKETSEIAAQLFVSTSQVRRMRERINRLAGTSNAYSIICWAWQQGYISVKEVWGKAV